MSGDFGRVLQTKGLVMLIKHDHACLLLKEDDLIPLRQENKQRPPPAKAVIMSGVV